MKIIQSFIIVMICTIFFSSCESEINTKSDNQSTKMISTLRSINITLDSTNELNKSKNSELFKYIKLRAFQAPSQFDIIFKYSNDAKKISKQLDSYLDNTRKQKEKIIQSAMDNNSTEKIDLLFDYFYNNNELNTNGIELLEQIDNYRNGMTELISELDLETITQKIELNFRTDIYRNENGNNNQTLNDKFESLNLINLYNLQYEITAIEYDILSTLLIEQLTEITASHNYSTILDTKKKSYSFGDVFDGEILLTRLDPSMSPNEIELYLDGKTLNYNQDYIFDMGRIKLNIDAGMPGVHKIEGNLTFLENNTEIKIPINSTFTTVQKSN